MRHGIEAYYRQRERDERRLAAILSGVSFAALALSGLVLLHSALEYARTGRPPARQWPEFFGFEGREQYVRRIYLETAGPPGPRPGRPTIYFPSVTAQKGGRDPFASSADPHARPDTRRVGQGPGESTADLMARARVLYGGSAVVIQSEDLVIEELVKPEYPENARERNAEGLIAFVATVDVTGAVTRVDLLSSTGDRELEEAAAAAVRQCRFRPYRMDGVPTEVHAVFRFNFRIYD
jgi:TonB family protein